jgi:flavin reductase (DIM6/NTAB) family NADH-FMN oxidoreductase RutF
MPVTAEQFRSAMQRWASGVSIVTTTAEDGIRGITVSSFCSLSLQPPLVLICISRDALSHRLIETERRFAINVLKAGQRRLADLAAGRSGERGNRLVGVPHRKAVTGAPILPGCLAWLDCSLVASHPGGDHTIFVGRVEAAGQAEGRPLLYFGGDYRRMVGARARPRRKPAREPA